MMHYLSRAFVEFGPFSTEEMLSFQQRGLLKDTDYIRAEGTDTWIHVGDWQTVDPDVPKVTPTKVKAASTKPKSALAKKAATKKAKKAA